MLKLKTNKQMDVFNTPVFMPKPYPVNYLKDFLGRIIYNGNHIMLKDPQNPFKPLVCCVFYYGDGVFIGKTELTPEMAKKSAIVKPSKSKMQ